MESTGCNPVYNAMRKLVIVFIGFLLTAGCASNPLLTGKPHDWQGKPATDLKTALGEPTRVIPQSDGTEIWEYVNSGDYVAPKEENTSFRMGGAGGGGMFGASGGINTVSQGPRLSRYENV